MLLKDKLAIYLYYSVYCSNKTSIKVLISEKVYDSDSSVYFDVRFQKKYSKSKYLPIFFNCFKLVSVEEGCFSVEEGVTRFHQIKHRITNKIEYFEEQEYREFCSDFNVFQKINPISSIDNSALLPRKETKFDLTRVVTRSII